ncbi:MAG: NUDIX hydrolase [Lentisphaeria bacterium]|nr:NUDIX hydrolase [Lentisphaeria bacterium]
MRRLDKQIIGSGDWLTLARVYYEGHDGVTRTWETVNRKNSRGAVGILATMKDTGELVLIRQYRPPLDRFAIEFPAGLIDDGEEPGEAALRELREETGYKGELKKISDRAYSSPGLTDEFLIFARVEIDPAVQGEIQTDFDEAESIETFLVAPENLHAFLENARKNGDVVDAKVVAYAFSTDLL